MPGPLPLHHRQSRTRDPVASSPQPPRWGRRQADTDKFADTYQQHRPMIERTIAWLVRNSHRRLRYRGIKRNQLAWSHRCAAINLKRLLTHCRWLDVKASTFYKWFNREPTERERRRAELDGAVKASFDDSGGTPGTYGSPRVWEDLAADGWSVSVNTVALSMVR
ncbi:MAG: hypothetical protein GY713_07425, partial [Actinomycetia bacterium]|nr:hypothetical protein [Actinomycetes bacterium]